MKVDAHFSDDGTTIVLFDNNGAVSGLLALERPQIGIRVVMGISGRALIRTGGGTIDGDELSAAGAFLSGRAVAFFTGGDLTLSLLNVIDESVPSDVARDIYTSGATVGRRCTTSGISEFDEVDFKAIFARRNLTITTRHRDPGTV